MAYMLHFSHGNYPGAFQDSIAERFRDKIRPRLRLGCAYHETTLAKSFISSICPAIGRHLVELPSMVLAVAAQHRT